MTREFISYAEASCGCIEETWRIGCLDVTIHFEREAGEVFADCFVDAGDWDVTNRHVGEPHEAREAAFAFIESWPSEEELLERKRV